MRCKKHPADVSSAVGVCSSCLRERLLALMAAQAQLGRRKSEILVEPPPVLFPPSVSPYVSRRKVDDEGPGAATWWIHGCRSNKRFYTTPQVGSTGGILAVEVRKDRKRNGGRFLSLLLNLFRSKTDNPDPNSGPYTDTDPDPGVLGYSCTASPSWFSAIVPSRRKKQSRTFSLDGVAAEAGTTAMWNRGRGMSPERHFDDGEDEHYRGGSSGYSSESSQGWRRIPRRTPAAARRGSGVRGPGHSRNVSSMAFCLSPLVRASPNRHWTQKGGVPPEAMVVSGEPRAPPMPHLSTAASFCKNRSRKLADFGRYVHDAHR